MHWVVVLALSGCNWIYALDATVIRDAGQFDAPLDAPFQCPRGLQSGPTFSLEVQQYLSQDCESFSMTASGQAVAACTPDGTVSSQVSIGEPGKSLVAAVGAAIGTETPVTPRLSPDGQRLLAIFFDGTQRVVQFAREPNGSWRRVADPPFGSVFRISPIASGPAGDRILVIRLPAYDVVEWELNGATWRMVRAHPLVDVHSVSLTHDGLAVLVMPRDLLSARYSDRTDLTQTFRPSIEARGIPLNAEDPFLAADCSGVYLTGLATIFFAQRQ